MLLVEAGIDKVNVFLVQLILRQPQALTEALEVDNLPGAEEFAPDCLRNGVSLSTLH